MPALLILVLLLAGCARGRVASDGVPMADAPFTLTAFAVGHPIVRIRCQDTEVLEASGTCGLPPGTPRGIRADRLGPTSLSALWTTMPEELTCRGLVFDHASLFLPR
jgi:hypothetical protein